RLLSVYPPTSYACPPPPPPPLFPYTTLFRSAQQVVPIPATVRGLVALDHRRPLHVREPVPEHGGAPRPQRSGPATESQASATLQIEEHTSELQSRVDLVCRLLLENKNNHLY